MVISIILPRYEWYASVNITMVWSYRGVTPGAERGRFLHPRSPGVLEPKTPGPQVNSERLKVIKHRNLSVTLFK